MAYEVLTEKAEEIIEKFRMLCNELGGEYKEDRRLRLFECFLPEPVKIEFLEFDKKGSKIVIRVEGREVEIPVDGWRLIAVHGEAYRDRKVMTDIYPDELKFKVYDFTINYMSLGFTREGKAKLTLYKRP